jgi:hypothetical protein
MTTIQDDRLRALMACLEEMTPPAPEFESLGSGSSQRNRPGGRTIIAIAAALVIIITGLVWIGSRRDDSSPADQRPLTTHAVATQLPAGWEVKGATEGSGAGSPGFGDAQLFATADSPAGPVLALLNVGDGSFVDEPTQSNVTLADGRRAAIGSSHFADGRSLDVEADSGRWVDVLARGISDDDLMAIGTMVRVDAAGYSSLEGPLPDGLLSVGTSPLLGGVITLDYSSDSSDWAQAATITGYGPVGASADASIASFPTRQVDKATLGAIGQVTTVVDVGGKSKGQTYAVDFGDHAGVGIYRSINGLGFLARSATLDTSQLLSMIDSLEAVDDDAWAALVDRRSAARGRPVENTTVASTMAPPPTYASSDVEPTRVSIEYAVTKTDTGYLATATIPAGEVSITARFVGRSVLVDASFDGESLQTATVDVGQGSGTYSTSKDVGGSSFYLFAVPASDPSAELRVTVDGYEYSTSFISIDSTYTTRIAMLLVPPTEGRTTRPTGYVYDADGKPLQSLPPLTG